MRGGGMRGGGGGWDEGGMCVPFDFDLMAVRGGNKGRCRKSFTTTSYHI